MDRIVPTIGRKVYFEPNGENSPHVARIDPSLPVDATVVFVHPQHPDHADGPHMVNLFIVDHNGVFSYRPMVPMIQAPLDAEPLSGMPYAHWMPFQIGQAAKVEEAKSPEPVSAATQSAAPAPSAPTADAQSAVATINGTVLTMLDFGGALAWLKQGKAVTRKGWPLGVFVYYVPAASYPAQTGVAKQHFGDNAKVPYGAYLAMKRADETVIVFNPGIDSILSEDWYPIL